MKGFSISLLCLFLIKFTNANEMVYEFGADHGQLIYSKDGNIPILQYETTIDIPVPENVMVTYIKVTVFSLSPPKVDYDALYSKVTIKYTWTQITLSSYKIIVKGIFI